MKTKIILDKNKPVGLPTAQKSPGPNLHIIENKLETVVKPQRVKTSFTNKLIGGFEMGIGLTLEFGYVVFPLVTGILFKDGWIAFWSVALGFATMWPGARLERDARARLGYEESSFS